LFVRQFALELAASGHTVIVQPVARKPRYISEPGIVVVPTPWKGGDRELASMNLLNPLNWLIFLQLIISGVRNTLRINRNHRIDRVLCMWAVPSGIFGWTGKLSAGIPYDVWALGSDIWKIRKIPVFGKILLRMIMRKAGRVYADGLQLCRDVVEITSVDCAFLASSRILPRPQERISFPDEERVKHFLFVGRYHVNKGPDLLLEAVSLLPNPTREAIRFHMFGLGPLETELRGMVEDLRLGGSVSLHGPIQAQGLSNYLASVDYLVISSRIESIPLVFSDAMQRGTPVVSMPVGDLGELIEESGCGIVAADVSAEALATALEKAVLMDRSDFETGTARAYARFEIRTSVAKWLDVASSPV